MSESTGFFYLFNTPPWLPLWMGIGDKFSSPVQKNYT